MYPYGNTERQMDKPKTNVILTVEGLTESWHAHVMKGKTLLAPGALT